MIKNNKWKLIISSIITMIPALFGIIGSKYLPEKIASHWGLDGETDGFMNPVLAFIIIPSVLLAAHWLCIILTVSLDKNAPQNKKLTSLIFFLMPVMSLFICSTIFAVSLGYKPSIIFALIIIMVSLVFIFIGNYLPKTTRNRTMGVRIKWTLSSDENWLATHRLAGKVFVAAGVLSLFSIPLPVAALPFVFIVIIAACGIIPSVYSYRFYKKQLADGSVTKDDYKKEYDKMMKSSKPATVTTIILVPVILIFVAILMFTGNIKTTLGDTSFTVEADFFDDLTLDYEKIDSVEYREDGVDGVRNFGFASARLLLGVFSNDEFGNYTRYTYTGDNPCIVIKSGDRVIVLGASDGNETKAMYDSIMEKISQ